MVNWPTKFLLFSCPWKQIHQKFWRTLLLAWFQFKKFLLSNLLLYSQGLLEIWWLKISYLHTINRSNICNTNMAKAKIIWFKIATVSLETKINPPKIRKNWIRKFYLRKLIWKVLRPKNGNWEVFIKKALCNSSMCSAKWSGESAVAFLKNIFERVHIPSICRYT